MEKPLPSTGNINRGRLNKDVIYRDWRGTIFVYVEGTEFDIQSINTPNLSVNTSIGVIYNTEFSLCSPSS